MTVAELEQTSTARPRFIGVDVARGLALFGMMAVHSFAVFTDGGSPSAATVIAGGRAAATFAFVAGVSLTFLSGGRTVVRGRRRAAAVAGIAVRGVLIGLIGLVLGYLDSAEVILPFYGLMFLLAIPLLGLRPRTLALLAAGFAVLGPVLLVASARHGLSYQGIQQNPTLTLLVEDPVGLVTMLFLTGAYPVVAYFSYVCAGMAVGRLDLSSPRLARRLLVGGVAAAVLAKLGSWILLDPMGGLDRLVAAGAPGGHAGVGAAQQLLWEPRQGSSWWYLALSSPHANTPLDLAHTTGVAMAVLGAALLLTRRPAVARALQPVADVGTMTLTLYSAHLVLLLPGIEEDAPTAFLLMMILCATGFAVLWRRRCGQGPMEGWVARAATRARRAVAGPPAPVPAPAPVPRPDDDPVRPNPHLLEGDSSWLTR